MRVIVREATRDGVADVMVALKLLRRRPGLSRGRERQPGLVGPELDAAIDRWALKYPDRVH